MTEAEQLEFEIYKKQAKRVCKDIYGLNTPKYKIMVNKIDNCSNSTQVSNTMAWGRVNLMR